LNKLVNDARQKNTNGQCINDMHYFDIDIIWPIWILFPKEVHVANLAKKLNTEN